MSCRVSDEYSRFLNKIVGTPGYIDPILLNKYKEGLKITDELRRDEILRTDLFSVASTFVYMATGFQMIYGETTREILSRTLRLSYDKILMNFPQLQVLSYQARDLLSKLL